MTNVLPNTRDIKPNIPENIQRELNLQDQYSEVELVTAIWEHFYHMMKKLKEDPAPRLKENRPLSSIDPADYIWGFTSEDLNNYIFHAESFYQLFCFKYTSDDLTPYMIKVIDYGPYFMQNLSLPISRFQAEGGEHVNYEHGSYYYNHTTCHGGNFSLDPLLAIFRNMWKRLSYAISSQTGTLEGRMAANAFQLYKTQHKAASVIQRAFRKHCLKKVTQDFGTPAKLQGVFCGLKFVFSDR